MTNQPLVSIGIPVYNGGNYLEECLDSVLKQTWQNWECVIVDNCSKDETNAIAKRFTKADSRFHLIENKDFVDQTSNWNIAFSGLNSESKYAKILCADDWIFPEYIERMVDVMEKYPSTGMCSSYRIDGESVNCDKLDYYSGNFFKGKEVLINQLCHKYDITGSVSTVLFRTEILKRISNYPAIFKTGTYHIDTELAFEVLSISDLGFVFQVLSYTRRHNETYTSLISNRFNTGLYFREKELFKYQNLDSILPELYKKIRRKYALMILKNRIKGNKDLIAWHTKYLDSTRQFTSWEFLKALLYGVKTKFLK